MKQLAWLMVFGLLLSGCITARADELAPATSHVPEDALGEWAAAEGGVSDLTLRQVVHIDERRAAVLASFYPDGWTYALPALALFYVEQEGERWRVVRYDYSSDPRLEADVLTLHNHGNPGHGAFPAAYGLVMDERAATIAVVWDDGIEEKIPVVGGAYLGLRPDRASAFAARAAALDSADTILAEITP